MKKHYSFFCLTVVAGLFLFLNGTHLHAQTDNLGFEKGDFSGWYGKTGVRAQTYPPQFYHSQVNVFVFAAREWNSSELANIKTTSSSNYCNSAEPNSNRFVINSNLEEYDRNVMIDGNNKVLPKIPAGYTHSARIGNACPGAEAEALFYRFQVTEETTLLTIMHAIVSETPHPGQLLYNPVFDVVVYEENPVGSGNYSNIDSLAKYHRYRLFADPSRIPIGDTTLRLFNGQQMLYRKWTPMVVNLSGYVGKNIEVAVSAGDCTPMGHYGYSYVTGKFGVAEVISEAYSGDNDTVAYASAPEGLAYTWVPKDTDPTDTSKVLSREQNVYLTVENFAGDSTIALECHTRMLIIGEDSSIFSTTIRNKKPVIDFHYRQGENYEVRFDSTKAWAHYAAIDETSHRWNFGDGAKSNEAKPKHQYSAIGNYEVTYSVSTLPDANNKAYTITKRQSIQINQAITGIAISLDSVSLDINETVQLAVSKEPDYATEALEANWLSMNSAIATVDSNGTVKGIAAGETFVKAFAKNNTIQDSCLVIVLGGVGICDADIETSNFLNVYPNPTSKVLYIESAAPIMQIEIFDQTGKQIGIENFKSRLSGQLKIATYPKGVYLIQVTTSKGIIVKKILKQ